MTTVPYGIYDVFDTIELRQVIDAIIGTELGCAPEPAD